MDKSILFFTTGRADRSMLESIKKECSKYFKTKLSNNVNDVKKYDYLFVLGDRWELMGAITEAIKYNKPILHQGGGEVSEGSYDNTFREIVSRQAKYHFVIDQDCADNLDQIGIRENVYICKSPRIDGRKIKHKTYQNKNNIIVIYHPATNTTEDWKEIKKVFKEWGYDARYKIIYIKPGNDIGTKQIKLKGKTYNQNKWNKLLENCMVMIGNSSAGFTECPSYGIPFINIGERQKNRKGLKNIINSKCEYMEIIKNINKGIGYQIGEIIKPDNTFSDGKASERIANILKEKFYNENLLRSASIS